MIPVYYFALWQMKLLAQRIQAAITVLACHRGDAHALAAPHLAFREAGVVLHQWTKSHKDPAPIKDIIRVFRRGDRLLRNGCREEKIQGLARALRHLSTGAKCSHTDKAALEAKHKEDGRKSWNQWCDIALAGAAGQGHAYARCPQCQVEVPYAGPVVEMQQAEEKWSGLWRARLSQWQPMVPGSSGHLLHAGSGGSTESRLSSDDGNGESAGGTASFLSPSRQARSFDVGGHCVDGFSKGTHSCAAVPDVGRRGHGIQPGSHFDSAPVDGQDSGHSCAQPLELCHAADVDKPGSGGRSRFRRFWSTISIRHRQVNRFRSHLNW